MRSFVVIFSVINLIFLFIIVYLVIENKKLEVENLALNFSVEAQNRLIKEQELQIQNYVCDIDSMKAYALKEYERAFNATKDDKTCEGRLKHLETILKSYED